MPRCKRSPGFGTYPQCASLRWCPPGGERPMPPRATAASGSITEDGDLPDLSGMALLGVMSDRKREIIRSLASSFATRGYHAVGMRELAQAVGLNQGTLYHYFSSKNHALLAVCLVGQDETHGIVAAVLEETEDFSERIRLLFDRYLHSLDTLGDFIDVFANQRGAVPHELSEPLRSGWAKTRELYRRIFDEAAEDGAIAKGTDANSAILMLVGVYRMTNMLHRTKRKAEIKPFIDLAVSVLINGFSKR